MGLLSDLFGKKKKEEPIEERIDPVVEKLREEKFSTPLIYSEDEEEEEEVAPAKNENKNKRTNWETKHNVAPTIDASNYEMREIISPMKGREHVKQPADEPAKPVKKRSYNQTDELYPVISPIRGAIQFEEETKIVEDKSKGQKKAVKKIKSATNEDNRDASSTQNLRDISKVIEDEKSKLKIVEASTGEFQLEFNDPSDDETAMIEEIGDEMTLDELLSLYEKNNKNG